MDWGAFFGGIGSLLAAVLIAAGTMVRARRTSRAQRENRAERADSDAYKDARATYSEMVEELRREIQRLHTELDILRNDLNTERRRGDKLADELNVARGNVRALARAARDAGLPVPAAEEETA